VRGLQLAYAEYVGDDPDRITVALQRAFASGDVVFSTGGIGATPDDHTRQCAARALGLSLALHPKAKVLIEQRMQDLARELGKVYEPQVADNLHRLNMGVFPEGADIIPNPYNKIPGFFCAGNVQFSAGPPQGGVYFVPGFPVMAWPMVEWVLDTHYRAFFQKEAWLEQSVIVFGAMEATLTPLMEQIETDHPGVKVFSLPSVDHPQFGRHIELGVKGVPGLVAPAYTALLSGLKPFNVKLGPEMVQS
jgi:molybdopterin-biosynthesis enzyme MoeA-like protein